MKQQSPAMRFKVLDLGLVDFSKALDLQQETFEAIKENTGQSALLICRHQPVITLGSHANRNNILATEEELKQQGIPVIKTNRGGDVTYHGPGQITVYPVFDLNSFKRDIHLFLRNLEQVVIDFLGDFAVKGERILGLTGVWVGESKISSIGICIRHWITYHGVSINIKNNDLDNFKAIRPCGLDLPVTSLEACLGKDVDIGESKKVLIRKFEDRFLN